MESTPPKQHEVAPMDDDMLPLLDARDSIHAALLEDKTPEILFHEDAIGDTDSEAEEEDDAASTDGSVVFDDDKLVMCRSAGRVGSKHKWGHEPLAADFQMKSVGVDLSDGALVKVEGYYLPEDEEAKGDEMQVFQLKEAEVILKVHLFRVRREIHAIQFVTNLRTSDRFGGTKHGELCKALEAPEGSYIASFFGDLARGEEEIDLGVRFADRPKRSKPAEVESEDVADVAEIDRVN
jgi:hypothetical protein